MLIKLKHIFDEFMGDVYMLITFNKTWGNTSFSDKKEQIKVGF